jgi:thioester reductase-like protein
VFELVIIKNSKTDKYHGISETFPTVHEYRTRDLYAPSTPEWWRYQGRADDLIVLSNGEKINPIPMENIVRTHAKVRAAVVVGEYRFNPSLLIEMEDGNTPSTSEERREALNEIWPLVQEANRIAPAFAKVPKSLVLFTTPGKPFLRAGKGTVQRQNTVKAYSNELSEIYSSQEADLLTEGLTLSTPISLGIIKTFTREIYWQVMGMKDVKYPTNLVDSDNVFEAGMDSLGAMIIVQRLRAALKLCGAPVNLNAIDSRLVYSAPTIGQISEAIITLLKSSDYLEKESGTATRSVRQQKMQGVLQKYSRDIPNLRESAQKPHQQLSGNALPNKAWKVILTGSTGSLGSYLLAALEARPNSQVDKIFCLNRSPHSEERQKRASSSRGLNSVWSDGRVEFLQANLSQPDLGLIPEKYSELIDEATIIIHSAWRVDFNLTIESFEPQIHGVRNLLELSSKSQRRPPLVFISSISTAFSWLEKHSGAKVPKATLHDFNAPEEVGYSESKFVSELLVERFAKESGITTAIFRTGQIAGSLFKKGSWNKQEWFPSIVASSKHLNVLPRTLGSMETIDWIPVDLLSTIMVELIGQLLHKNSTDGEAHVYNLVNPKATSWSNLLPEFQGLSGIKQTLPFKDWVWELEKSAVENRGNFTERNPAVKLLDFFRHSSQKGAPSEVESRFEVGNLIRDSRQAAELKTVSSEWMKLWMDQWGF